MGIEVRNLHKRFGATVVCDNLNLDIPSGELVALLGPSGSGKTTLLRIIAGLEVPDSGNVLFQGEDATRADVRGLAIFSQSGTFIKFVARKGIDDVKQAKKFGVVVGSVSEFSTVKLLQKYGIDEKSVQFVKAGPPEFPALLARGDVDGYFLWEPWPANGVKQGGKINVASGAIGGQQGLGIVMTDEATPTVESLGMVVDGNALAVTNTMGANVGSAEVKVDGTTYTITGEATGADISNPMAGMITKPFTITVTCN